MIRESMFSEAILRVKYPWSHYAQSFIKRRYSSIEEALNSSESLEAMRIALRFIRDFLETDIDETNISKGTIPPGPLIQELTVKSIPAVLSFPFANMLVARLPERARLKYAEKWTKRAYLYMQREDPRILLEIAKNTFGIRTNIERVVKGGITYFAGYKVNVIDFLDIAAEYGDDSLSLAIQQLEGGYVFLKKSQFALLLREALRIKLRSILSQNINITHPLLEDAMKKIAHYASIYAPKYKQTQQSSMVFPPCMRRVIERLSRGENPSHFERLFLAIFLVNKKVPDDEIVRIFSGAPDFKEKIVRYHIEYIKKKGYLSYSCEKIRARGFCFPDEKCKKIKNPLQYR